VQANLGSFGGVYSKVRVDPVYPSGIEYVYVFSEAVDASGVERIDSFRPVLRAAFFSQVAPELEAAGFPHPSATWTYRNPDRSLVWTHTFRKS
jgi:hypothetical protein